MNTGHDGSLSTGHANSTEDMLSRLETMVLQGAAGLPLDAIRQQIASSMLQAQSAEVWNLRKQNVRRQGEKAASKLMIPIFMMFFGILIMVIIPIFSNIGV